MFVKKYVTFTVEKNESKNFGYFCNFPKTAQSKQSPNRLKFAQYVWSP
jgi:hypothetical protein